MSQELAPNASTSTSVANQPATTPLGLRRPCDRDLEIYRRVKIWRHL